VPVDLAEVRLICDVDQVFVHSPGLLERFGSLNPNTAVIPNGVDYAAFATPTAEPLDVRAIPRPRIGYIGMIKRHLDWVLLEQLIEAHHDWSFVFVGAVEAHPTIVPIIERLSRRQNVYFLGSKRIRELSAYPQHMDVCMMPYCRSDYSAQFIYPLKLHEYLASGAPVVGTNIRSLEKFAEVITLANSPVAWSAAIARNLGNENRSDAKRAWRQAVAREHDWDALVDNIATRLLRRLDHVADADRIEAHATQRASGSESLGSVGWRSR
jgi:glycosyltransferase involved in cell wall biosynthesis